MVYGRQVQMWKKASLVLFFLFYTVVLTLVLLVVRFPDDEFLDFGAAQLEKLLPGSSCSIAAITYHYPLTLNLHGISITNASGNVAVLIDEGELRFDAKRPLAKFFTRFTVFDADVAGEILLHRDREVLEILVLSIRGFELSDFPALERRLERSISGIVSFTGTYLASLDSPAGGTLDGKLRADGLRLPLRRPILDEQEIRLETVTVDILAAPGMIGLSHGAADGPAYQGNFSGEIRTAEPWWQSELAITGEFLPRPDYRNNNRQATRAVGLLSSAYGAGSIPCTVSGTLAEPVFTVDSGRTR